MTLVPALVLITNAALPFLAGAQTERAHEAHVHGLTRIETAYESGRLDLELHAPGMDIVGFEHPPRDAGERRALDAALAGMEAVADWLGFEPDDACTVVTIDAHAHGYKPGDAEAGTGGDDHGDHGDDHGHDGHHDDDSGHAEFHVEVKAACSMAPDAMLIRLARRFPRIETVRVDFVTETTQNRVELTRGDERVPLR